MSRRVLQNPLATIGQLTSSPSHLDGIPSTLERDLRNLGAELIQTAGILLKQPQVVMATAQVLFQRFYFMASLKDFDIVEIGLGAIFLAAKLEERSLRMTHLVTVYDHVLRLVRHQSTLPPLDPFSRRTYDLRSMTIDAEMHILKQLGFNVQVQLPYSLMINYLRILDLEEDEKIPTVAWNYLNDSLRTVAHVAYAPEVIAVAAIWLACRQQGIKLPTDAGNEWWLLFDVSELDFKTVGTMIMVLYQQPIDRLALPLTTIDLKELVWPTED
ncbi:cyclin-L1 [Hesseltinella vesiculosa]|uniref:Cyclin-L1 n=1 Tax=Hesseltinella vesiculosa TaxID=101127 RepID=A0A1X2GJK0_9FUNG|nr:cyclin-L1 [Hesseltinella vesiculosa]